MNRYSRHIVLSEVGQEGQDKLSNAKVLVIGAGGLGCPILQYLTAAGVGTIGIVDFDIVEESNLQRQILFGTSTLGMNKAIAAKERLTDLNPEIVINAYPERLTVSNAISLCSQYDIVVDGTDNFETRYLINDSSIITGKPLVYGAIYKFEGQVSVFNYNNSPSYRCLFPTPPKKGSIANCSEVGVLGVLPGIIGTIQANEVIKIILGFEHILSGKLFCYDSKNLQSTVINIRRSQTEIDNVLSRGINLMEFDEHISCDHEIQVISAEQALIKKNALFIDVREPHEIPRLDFLECKTIPLAQLEDHIGLFNNINEAIIFCQSGVRSKAACELLAKHGITNCYSLTGGAQEMYDQFKITTQ